MNSTSFEKLSVNIQSCFLWAEGETVGSYKVEDGHIKLYTIYGFFVEVKFFNNSEEIENISVLKDFSDLDPFLTVITLPEDILRW